MVQTNSVLLLVLAQLFAADGFFMLDSPRKLRLSPPAASKNNGESALLMNNTSGTDTTLSSIQFGDSVPNARFGEVVSLRRRPGQKQASVDTVVETNDYLIPQTTTTSTDDSALASIAEAKRRNLVVAVASIFLSMSSYVWQFLHPVTPVQLLYKMQQNSQPISVVGANQKPTVVDFWAPWCENCKLIAPTLLQIEEEYKDKVNFVMVDGDKSESWPYIEAFGVDAIPHLALVSAEGDVETALIGPIPKGVLEADLNTMLENAKHPDNPQQHQRLPHQMLDVFAGRPEARRINFQ